MKRLAAGISMVLLCTALLSGCAEKKEFDVNNQVTETTETSAVVTVDDETEEAVSEAKKQSGSSHTWEGCTFELTDLTEDLGNWKNQTADPEGKWVMAVFTITDGQIKCSRLSDLIMDNEAIRLGDHIAMMISEEGISIDDNMDFQEAYAVGKINVFFDVDKDYVIDQADIYVDDSVSPVAETEEEKADETKVSSDSAEAEVKAVEGITVRSGEITRPEDGKMIYSPSGASGYFAVDGSLKAQSAIHVGIDATGILNYDLSLALDAAQAVKAEIHVSKNGEELVTYAEEGLELPEGDAQINACVLTGEDSICEGEYKVQFYINDVLIAEDANTLE